jgi:hypothetical protein
VLVEVLDDVLGQVGVAALLHLLGGPAVALAVEAAPVVAPACPRTKNIDVHDPCCVYSIPVVVGGREVGIISVLRNI